jgi:hypothetical protein
VTASTVACLAVISLPFLKEQIEREIRVFQDMSLIAEPPFFFGKRLMPLIKHCICINGFKPDVYNDKALIQVSPVIPARRKGKASKGGKPAFPAPTLAMVQQAFQMLDPTGSGILNPYAIADVILSLDHRLPVLPKRLCLLESACYHRRLYESFRSHLQSCLAGWFTVRGGGGGGARPAAPPAQGFLPSNPPPPPPSTLRPLPTLSITLIMRIGGHTGRQE